MAIATRYFSTTGAGAADGTTWADRAPLLSAGAWSTVITGFNFASTDALRCLIGPGTYSLTTSLASGLFANPPTAINSFFLNSCDSSGNLLAPPVPNWTADMPVTWDSGFPEIATTTNISSINLATCNIRGIKFSASGATFSPVINAAATVDWVSVYNTTSGTSVSGASQNALRITNSYFMMSGTSYAQALQNITQNLDNIRIEGNPSASSGNRNGISFIGTTTLRSITRFCVFNHAGSAVVDTSTNVNLNWTVLNSVFANCGTNGVTGSSTASQALVCAFRGCMVTGLGGYGIDGGASNIYATQNRLRNNTSGNSTNMGNYPFTSVNDVSNIYGSQAAADAAEYVNSAGGDFRIKYGSPIWGMGYGVSQETPSGGSPTTIAYVSIG